MSNINDVSNVSNNNIRKRRSGTIQYLLDPVKYENYSKCRNQLGLVGGANVSHIKGNLVDLESDLKGQTRRHSLCSATKYKPCNENKIEITSNETNKKRIIDTNLIHLRSCQMIDYKPVPLPQNMVKPNCPLPNRIYKH